LNEVDFLQRALEMDSPAIRRWILDFQIAIILFQLISISKIQNTRTAAFFQEIGVRLQFLYGSAKSLKAEMAESETGILSDVRWAVLNCQTCPS